MSSSQGAPAQPNAMQGLATGNRKGKSAQRDQQIYTPWEVIEVVHATWPEGIQLDPCSGPDSIVPAERALFGTREDTGRKDRDGSAICRWLGAGLTEPWVERCYVNPPYEELELWLERSATCAVTEQILLFPVRPNRSWWTQYMCTLPSVVAWLKPLRFVGFVSGFPAPLVLVYCGARETMFREAAAALSTFVGGPLR